MPAANEKLEARARGFIPDMVREVIFWCTVFTAFVTAGLQISQIGQSWAVSVPSVQTASMPMVTPTSVAAAEARSTVSSVSELPDIPDASAPAEQPPTF